MPGYRKHLCGGIIAYFSLLLLCSGLNPTLSTAIEWLGFCLIGSLFPDIDIGSKGRYVFYRIFLLFLLVFLLRNNTVGLCLIGVLMALPMFVRHRGLFHRWWLVIGLPFAVAWLCSCTFASCKDAFMLDALFFAAGALSHLYLDLGLRRMMRVRSRSR
jgi:hypothetical protein